MRDTTRRWILLVGAAIGLGTAAAGGAENASRPAGEPVLERPTLRCLGAYWIVRGDENSSAMVNVEYRKAGQEAWRQGAPMFRVEKGAQRPERFGDGLDVPEDAWLFAGSVVGLEEAAAYELRLTLADPDGGKEVRVLSAQTREEPKAAADAPVHHVIPGSGGGSGTQADPYRGLAAAQRAAKPGNIFLLHRGAYEGTFTVSRSGEPGKPIIWRAAGDGEAVIDGKASDGKRAARGIATSGVHDVWFEGLTIRNADYGIVAHDSGRLVIRHCHIHQVEYGIAATRNSNGAVVDDFISDNLIEGPSTWPRTKGIENARGIQVTGAGHVVCYNRVRGFADAIDTMPSMRCEAIDIHNNEISEMTDDGIEMDYSQRNTRCFENRMTNVFQGISVQPVYGGPIYIFRNAMYNVCVETFKMHNGPSGALMYHNTSVKKGMPLVLWTNAPVHNSIYRNNLFIGTDGPYGYDCMPRMEGCDFDYDGFGGGPFGNFLRWNRVRYRTLAEASQKAPVYRHAVMVDAGKVFAKGIRPPADETVQVEAGLDLRLARGSEAVDAGVFLPGFSDGCAGKGPDLGAYEIGAELPVYGPRSQRP